jgi:ribosome-dependent ATPase
LHRRRDGDRPARPERIGQDDADAGDRWRPAGRLRIGALLGEPAGAASVRARVGYVTQARGLYEDLTVRENVRYFCRVAGAPAARAEEVLGTVRLEHLGPRVVRTLSGGERARASLATALVARPAVLILDEPTVGLDPVLRRDLWRTFHRLADEGAALLVSSHVMDEAANCDELVLLRDGDIPRPRYTSRAAEAHPHARSRRGLPTSDRAGAAARRPRLGRASGWCRPRRRGARSMSARASGATAARVLRQLRHDLRTVALLLVVPCVLLTLLKYLFEDQPQTFDRIGVPLVGLFPLLQMFIVTSATMLRERTSGTLERLMASPLAKLDLLAGYGAAFALVGIAQASLVAT